MGVLPGGQRKGGGEGMGGGGDGREWGRENKRERGFSLES